MNVFYSLNSEQFVEFVCLGGVRHCKSLGEKREEVVEIFSHIQSQKKQNFFLNSSILSSKLALNLKHRFLLDFFSNMLNIIDRLMLY